MQHTVVRGRPSGPLAILGLLCVVFATVLAPATAEPLVVHNARSTTVTTPETVDSAGHILFRAARKKHKDSVKKAKKKLQEKHVTAEVSGDAVHAATAVDAANTANQAAKVAGRVANHAVKIEADTADALAYAKDALKGAAVQAGGLDKAALDHAVGRVGEATSEAAAAATRYTKTNKGGTSTTEMEKLDRQLGRLQNELDQANQAQAGGTVSVDDELRKLQQKLDAMKRAQQASPGGVTAATEGLQEKLRDLEHQMEASKVARAAGVEPPPGTATEDELKVKLEETREELGKLSGSQGGGVSGGGVVGSTVDPATRLRELQQELDKLRQLREKEAQLEADPNNQALRDEVDALRNELNAGTTPGQAEQRLAAEIGHLEKQINAAPGSSSGIDIDASLPFGEAEPFGRAQVASDLTHSSKHESNEMVDQIERAETMEERRAVFRALTRLRGATITAYDGIAKSHLNNVVQYNKEHKWRVEHPMKHLAQEEDDTAKWAFPLHSEEVPPAAAGQASPATAPAAAPAPGL